MPLEYIYPLVVFFVLALFASAFKIYQIRKREYTLEVLKKYIVYLSIVCIVSLVIFWDDAWVRFFFISLLLVKGAVEFNAQAVKLTNGRALMAFYLLIASGAAYSFVTFQAEAIASLFLFVVIFDGMSQVGGQLFGKHKMALNISPNKTWEGFFTGYISVLTCTLVTNASWLRFHFWQIFLVSTLYTLACVAGDLLASKVKRLSGVKDYGNVLPGHGGVIDRFDSFLVLLFACSFLVLINNLFLYL